MIGSKLNLRSRILYTGGIMTFKRRMVDSFEGRKAKLLEGALLVAMSTSDNKYICSNFNFERTS